MFSCFSHSKSKKRDGPPAYLEMPVKEWSRRDVAEWGVDVGLKKRTRKRLSEAGVNGEKLMGLDERQLVLLPSESQKEMRAALDTLRRSGVKGQTPMRGSPSSQSRGDGSAWNGEQSPRIQTVTPSTATPSRVVRSIKYTPPHSPAISPVQSMHSEHDLRISHLPCRQPGGPGGRTLSIHHPPIYNRLAPHDHTIFVPLRSLKSPAAPPDEPPVFRNVISPVPPVPEDSLYLPPGEETGERIPRRFASQAAPSAEVERPNVHISMRVHTSRDVDVDEHSVDAETPLQSLPIREVAGSPIAEELVVRNGEFVAMPTEPAAPVIFDEVLPSKNVVREVLPPSPAVAEPPAAAPSPMVQEPVIIQERNMECLDSPSTLSEISPSPERVFEVSEPVLREVRVSHSGRQSPTAPECSQILSDASNTEKQPTLATEEPLKGYTQKTTIKERNTAKSPLPPVSPGEALPYQAASEDGTAHSQLNISRLEAKATTTHARHNATPLPIQQPLKNILARLREAEERVNQQLAAPVHLSMLDTSWEEEAATKEVEDQMEKAREEEMMREREKHFKLEHQRLQKERLWEEQTKQVEWSRRNDTEFSSVREWKMQHAHAMPDECDNNETEDLGEVNWLGWTEPENEIREDEPIEEVPQSLRTQEQTEVVHIDAELEATYAKIEYALASHAEPEPEPEPEIVEIVMPEDSFVLAERRTERTPELVAPELIGCEVTPLRSDLDGLRPLQPLDFNEATILSVSDATSCAPQQILSTQHTLRSRILSSQPTTPTKPMTVDTLHHRPTTVPSVPHPFKLTEQDITRLANRTSPEDCLREALNKRRMVAMP